MKKTLLLSVVASTMIMAGGDIAPVEPVVEAPAPAASAWEFSGQGVVYYQTADTMYGDYSLFDQEASAADAGIQLKATNNDVIGGIGMGFAVNGLSTLNLENYLVDHVMQMTGNPVAGNDIDDISDGGWISEAYLTYGMGNTSIKAGRQTLPKALSPFAYSENWNVFANTFDSVLVVNTDISNTTLVGAWVAGGNFNAMAPLSNITDFNSLNADDGVYMLTVQNKSIADLTLTGSVYYGSDMGLNDDATILWGDAAYNAGDFNVAIQGGTMDVGLPDDMTAFGAKIGATLGGFDVMAAYSDVQDGAMGQLGGTTSALYTNTVANQLVNGLLEVDASKILVGAGVDALGGTFNAAYAMTDSDLTGDANEIDVSYATNVTDNLNVMAAYVNLDSDSFADELNVVRVVARYNF